MLEAKFFGVIFLKNYAILIDAGFLKRKLGSREKPATAEDISIFVEKLRKHKLLESLSLHRIYYYDAPPLRQSEQIPLSSEKMDFANSKLAKNNDALLKKLERMPYFALRLGEVVFRGWKLNPKRLSEKTSEITITKDDLQPNISQ